jgi:hypothetical protein
VLDDYGYADTLINGPAMPITNESYLQQWVEAIHDTKNVVNDVTWHQCLLFILSFHINYII